MKQNLELTLRKFLIILLLLPLSMKAIHAQDFYSMDKIQEIKLYFTQYNWNQLLVQAAQSTLEPYTFCQKVIINGVTFDSVGAKYKGNSTFNATRKKNPWHIELDNIKEQNYQGYKDIKLSNIFQDPSCVREALSYDLMQYYADLPRANYAKVWVNDTLIGLYTNVEAVTKTFCKKHFPSSDNNIFIKCTPPSLSGAGGTGSSLAFLGTDTTLYKRGYEVYSAWGWKELMHLCDTLNNKTENIEKILDVDRALWMLAFNVLFLNLDSYTGSFTQNYYLWRDDNRRFNSVIWDLNMSFGSFTNLGGGIPGTGSDTLAFSRISPFVHEGNAAKPLISKLLANYTYRKMFVAHIKTMLTELFKNGWYRTRGEQIRKVIDVAVQNDPNNLSTYNAFRTNFYYGGGGTGGNVTGIVSLMENRIKYLDSLSVMRDATPEITNINNTTAKIGDSTWITVKVRIASQNGVLIGYRHAVTGFFTKTPMFDDGLHRDGLSGDGIYGIGLKMSTPLIEYYIWAENGTVGIFSPERAEHEFHRINASFNAVGDVVINEVMASNTKTIADPKAEFDDWVELYNKAATPTDISGWYISDDVNKRKKWQFPTGTTIPANGYLIVWCDEDSSQNTATSFHSNFKISAAGETILLSQKDTSLVDQVTFGAQLADISYARRPNGTGNFVSQSPTYNANNNGGILSVKDVLSENALKIYPNPAYTEGVVTIEIDYDKSINCHIYNTLGQLVFNKNIYNKDFINTSNWAKGVYIVKVGNISKKLIVQ